MNKLEGLVPKYVRNRDSIDNVSLNRGLYGYTRSSIQPFDPRAIEGLEFWVSTRFLNTIYQDTGSWDNIPDILRSNNSKPSLATGDPVGTWLDISGKKRHLISIANSDRPTLKMNDIGGMPSIQMDFSDDLLRNEPISSPTRGTTLLVNKKGIFLYKSIIDLVNSFSFFLNGSYIGIHHELMEKAFWSSELSDNVKDEIKRFYRQWVPVDTWNSVSNFSYMFAGLIDMVEMPYVDLSSGTNFNYAFGEAYNLKSFPLLNTGNGTNFVYAWVYNSNLEEFPLIDTSKGTNFSGAWYYCAKLKSFPNLNMSNGTNFNVTWFGCESLISFPFFDLSKSTNFNGTWCSCKSLNYFPPNFFDNCSVTDYANAFANCDLSQASVDNILVSISTSATNKSLNNGTLHINGGTNATPSATGLSAKSVLTGRGWTVTHN